MEKFKQFIEAINGISQDVWAVLLILLGGTLLLFGSKLHLSTEIIGVLSSVVGAGCMAFKGGSGSKQ